ncbi:hypothetical protein GP486_006108 [Trichoglossum hirsutum]|uniref:Uncharacterized protein n=1 Tax=Trichoglossum hirsutum TaxID=265104 RepID=A0A9P8L7Z7_9PEZI|nr:hypothetical protein GP486_006108 [Trichoglossum hirsutum]
MEDPSVHKDLRSPSVSAHRAASRNDKYYNFRYVKPGQLDSPHCAAVNGPYPFPIGMFPADLREAPVVTLDKRRLYLQAQDWPRPPTYKRSNRNQKRWPKETSQYFNKKEQAIALARDRDGGRAMLEADMGDIDGSEGERDCELCEMAWMIREGKIAEEVERKRVEGMESFLDGAVERYRQKVRRGLEQDGWSYVDAVSLPSRDLDSEWEGASEGWETLSAPG